jgi:soluble lytic murein transglycosylase-like protein
MDLNLGPQSEPGTVPPCEEYCLKPRKSGVRAIFTLFLLLAILLLLLGCLLSTSALAKDMSSAEAGTSGIVAVHENGRTIYVNVDKQPTATPAAESPRRASVLVYWSNKQKRWKPVPAPSGRAVRAARDAAAEVSSYVGRQPRVATPAAVTSAARGGTLAVHNPNYRNLARGIAITSAEVDAAIEQAAARHRVDPNLVRAMVKVESNFNPQAVSRKGAMGLMQLMPATARQLNVSNPFDPQENVDAGVRYMKNLLNNFGGDVRLSLAAYNAGTGAVTRSGGVPHINETQNYVKQITDLYWRSGPIAMRSFGRSPIRVFRGANGVLTITNE